MLKQSELLLKKAALESAVRSTEKPGERCGIAVNFAYSIVAERVFISA
jgi:hypothetical protein